MIFPFLPYNLPYILPSFIEFEVLDNASDVELIWSIMTDK